jgi:hypothetical protein
LASAAACFSAALTSPSACRGCAGFGFKVS